MVPRGDPVRCGRGSRAASAVCLCGMGRLRSSPSLCSLRFPPFCVPELYVGQPPFYTNSIYSLIQLIVKENVKFPDDISPHFKSFLKGLLNKKPSERLSWPALLDHPFIAEGARGCPCRRLRGAINAKHSRDARAAA